MFRKAQSEEERRNGFARDDLGAVHTMLRDRNCSVDSCEGSAVASFAKQNLCLNHYLLACYEKLESVDPRGRKGGVEQVDLAVLRNFVEECSRKTLDVCFQCKDLTNLERGRLLDILLWTGELFVLLRAPRLSFADSLRLEEDLSLTHLAARRA